MSENLKTAMRDAGRLHTAARAAVLASCAIPIDSMGDAEFAEHFERHQALCRARDEAFDNYADFFDSNAMAFDNYADFFDSNARVR
ncbi:MAG: hypothetical protein JKY94_17390 [Rhodobacteraceae bacterium]|nr:hypothetical protein [Paracoccaceae bacterium]